MLSFWTHIRRPCFFGNMNSWLISHRLGAERAASVGVILLCCSHALALIQIPGGRTQPSTFVLTLFLVLSRFLRPRYSTYMGRAKWTSLSGGSDRKGRAPALHSKPRCRRAPRSSRLSEPPPRRWCPPGTFSSTIATAGAEAFALHVTQATARIEVMAQ